MGAAESHTAKKQVNVDEAKEFFSAKLVVGGDDKPETLLPISYWKEASEDEEATATFAYYCAVWRRVHFNVSTAPRRDPSRTQEPGVKFQVKCTLLRPPPDGVSYGARVYVDRGEPDTVYTSAAVEGDADDGIDTAVPDHYFWFGPGETEYVARRPRRKSSRRRRHRGSPAQVRGFFADTESSWPFQFGSAAAARRSLGSHNVADDEPEPKRARSSVSSADVRLAKEIGCVRVQFCKVVKWMKPLRHAATPRRASLPGSAAELCDRKGARVVAKAGTATVKDQEAATVEKEAVLSEKILHECRCFFNDFGGYRAQVRTRCHPSRHRRDNAIDATASSVARRPPWARPCSSRSRSGACRSRLCVSRTSYAASSLRFGCGDGVRLTPSTPGYTSRYRRCIVLKSRIDKRRCAAAASRHSSAPCRETARRRRRRRA